MSVFNSCRSKYENNMDEAKTFYKDTALMYLWSRLDNADYYYFKSNGDVFSSDTIADIDKSCWGVWYVKDDKIFRRYGVKPYNTEDGLLFTYKIVNDTLYHYGYNGGIMTTEPSFYVKIKHP